MRQCQPPREHMLVRQHGRSSLLSPRTLVDLRRVVLALVAQVATLQESVDRLTSENAALSKRVG